ncbi:drug/metabolite transporter superfamily [Armillaria mellea]|nr:drug/metabolite transporter superfamily [Armillaria mellea]
MVASSNDDYVLLSNSSDDVTVVESKSRWRRVVEGTQKITRDNAGLLLVTLSQFLLSGVNVAVKELNGIDPPVGTFELIVVRMSITYVCSVGYMLYAGVNDPFLGPKGVRLLLVFRGFSGFFGLFGTYFCLQYLSLSDATVLSFLAPFCTGISGAIFLKEKYNYREALAGLSSLVGVVLIARPTFIFGRLGEESSLDLVSDGVPLSDKLQTVIKPQERLMAVGVALIGVLGSTGAYTSLCAIGKRAHPLHALASFSAQSVIVGSIGMIVMRAPLVIPTQLSWGALLAVIGFLGFFAQVALTMGLQRETAGRGTIAIYTQIIFASIAERIFFHSTPHVLSVLGTLVILFSALYVAVCLISSHPG